MLFHFLISGIYFHSAHASTVHDKRFKCTSRIHTWNYSASYLLFKSTHTQVNHSTRYTGKKAKVLTCKSGILVIQLLWPTDSSDKEKVSALCCIKLYGSKWSQVWKDSELSQSKYIRFLTSLLAWWILRKCLIIAKTQFLSCESWLIWRQCLTQSSLKNNSANGYF